MIRLVSIAVLTICLLFSGAVLAGSIDARLIDRIDNAPADELIEVWIRPVMLEDKNRLIASATSNLSTRSERFQSLRQQLEHTHGNSQKWLVEHLFTMQSSGLATNIKPHWLINVIEAKVTAAQLSELAQNPKIEKIYSVPKLETIKPMVNDHTPSLATSPASLGGNLHTINAPLAWTTGYTGAGRVVCSFDTGVDGDHPALSHSWRGNDGNYAAAWFFPRAGGTTVPEVITDCGYSPCNWRHGTHTLGIMVGRDDSSGDTVGVAPDAQWIAAAVIDIAGTSIIDAFEWAANPDGDFNTISDIPDVINHSWGVADIECEDIFFDLIDYTEGLGIVNIFSAGNDGTGIGGGTIRNPANRANDSLDCFAVGNINTTVNPPVIWATSSRGPSDCNGAIKPNVVAPGYSIRSCYPNEGYANLTGTSMAAPHVSGLVALLRQKNPNATVREIKQAILAGINTDIGGLPAQPFPNNDYGWGMIDCFAALNALSSSNAEPNVRIFSFDHDPISPGDTINAFLILKNIGADALDISAVVTQSDPSLTILDGQTYYGRINEGDTAYTGDDFSIIVSDTVTIGRVIAIDLRISGNGYSNDTKLFVHIDPPSQRSFITHNSGRVEFSVSNYGTLGLGDGSYFPAGGAGFKFDGSDNFLYEAGLIIATGPITVSDGVRNAAGEPDADFAVMPGGNIVMDESGAVANQTSYCRFDDSRANYPIGLQIEQESYSWDDYPNDDFIVLRYIIKNINEFVSVGGIYVGLYLDWDIISYTLNSGGWDTEGHFLWTAFNQVGNLSDFRASMVLDGDAVTGFTALGALVYYSDDGFTEMEKYNALRDGFGTATMYNIISNDLVQLLAATPINLSPGQQDTVAFALMASDSLAGLSDVATRASEAYDMIPTDIDPGQPKSLPGQYRLHQNYPNPFNPSTTILFEMPRRGRYQLDIFNIVGQKVHSVSGEASAGTVSIEWNATGVASGIYLYKLTTEDFTDSRKMLLLK